MPQTSQQTLALCFALVASFVLTIAGFGSFWVGLPGACLLLAGAYAMTAFGAARVTSLPAALVATGLGLMPLAGILARFRDAGGSHLLPLAILSVWCGATLWGAWIGADRSIPLRRVVFAFAVASILHAMVTAAALVFSLGDAFSRFESGVNGQFPGTSGAASLLAEPMMSALSTGNVRLGRPVQWGFFAANSVNWGVAIALTLQTIEVYRRSRLAAV